MISDTIHQNIRKKIKDSFCNISHCKYILCFVLKTKLAVIIQNIGQRFTPPCRHIFQQQRKVFCRRTTSQRRCMLPNTDTTTTTRVCETNQCWTATSTLLNVHTQCTQTLLEIECFFSSTAFSALIIKF